MAVTKIWDIKGRISRVIDYAENPDKTTEEFVIAYPYSDSDIQDMADVMDYAMLDHRAQEFEHWRGDGVNNALEYATRGHKTEETRYVSALNCTPENARENMTLTKMAWQKTGGNSAYHGYQAFLPGEVTPQAAHEIGVKLAEKLWGDRFEVVIATHVDKGHLHNHFVLNSVSFADGLKYNDCTATYMRMRRVSDALCREYSLSVVENPKRGKAKHYTEWQADKEGKPTYRNMVKADVDAAIRQSMTERQFFNNLNQMGYHVKFGQDITVRPEGKDRGLKLHRNFGDDYSIAGIRRRILAQTRPERQFSPPGRANKKARLKPNANKARKITGLRALYYYYLYRMGVLPKKREPDQKQVYFLFREDIRHMRDMAREIRLLSDNRIDTALQLSAYMENALKQIADMSVSRKSLKDPAEKSVLTKKIAELRREVKLCENIKSRSASMSGKISMAKETRQNENKEKEMKKDEPFRRRR